MIGLDSNLFIYMLEANPEFGPAAKAIFLAVEQGEIEVCASALTYLEVLSHARLSEPVAIRVRNELRVLGVQFLPISEQVLLEAAKLRRQSQLGSLDAIHVASAKLAGCTHFVTNDEQLLKRQVHSIKLLALKDFKV